jgi:hypothetical protein
MDPERQKKNLIMAGGIALVMIFVFVLWVMNMRNVWRLNQASFAGADKANWEQLKADFNTTVGDINNRLKTVAAQNKLAAEMASSTVLNEIMNRAQAFIATSSTSSETTFGLPTAASVTTTATTTATTSPKIKPVK